MWNGRLLAGLGIACVFWFCAYTSAQRAAAPYAAMLLEEKIGQMVQVRVYADEADLHGKAFREELQAVAPCHAGSVDVSVHLDGPNLLRAKRDVAARSLNGLQAKSSIPLLVGADIERGVIARIADSPDMQNIMAYGAAGDPAQARRLGGCPRSRF